MARVLYLDGDAAAARDAVETLRGAGHTVRVAALDGPKVLERLRASRPDVLVISLEQRASEALAVAHAVRSSPPFDDLAMVLVGGDGDAGRRARIAFADALRVAPSALLRALR